MRLRTASAQYPAHHSSLPGPSVRIALPSHGHRAVVFVRQKGTDLKGLTPGGGHPCPPLPAGATRRSKAPVPIIPVLAQMSETAEGIRVQLADGSVVTGANIEGSIQEFAVHERALFRLRP
jgi:hypothetical protein